MKLQNKYQQLKTKCGRIMTAVVMSVLIFPALVSCMSTRGSSAGGEVTGVGGSAWAEPAFALNFFAKDAGASGFLAPIL